MTVPEAFAAAWARSGGDMSEAIRAALDAQALSYRQTLTVVTSDAAFRAGKNLAVKVGLLFGMNSRDLFGSRGNDRQTRIRFYAMWLVRRTYCLSLPEIGHIFGGRHHTTVLWAIRRAEAMLLEDPESRNKLDAIVAPAIDPAEASAA